MTTVSPAATPPAAADRRAPDRSAAGKEIAVFLGVTAALMVASTTVAIGQDVDVRHIEQATAVGQAAMYGQAFFPLLGALAARLAVAGTLRGAGFGLRRAPWRSIGLAWLYGLGTTLAGAALVWLTGLGGFVTGELTGMVPLGLTVLVLPYLVLAFGEDIGWRGLLVTRLAALAGPRTVVLVSGAAWAAFHVPLMVWLGGTPPGVPMWWAVAMFTVGGVALGAVLASMQLRWGLWPGVVAHAVANAAFYHVIAPLTRDEAHTAWFSTETGLGWAVAAVAGALLWLRYVPLTRTANGGTAAGVRR
jgi:membrane protease YdiL (CAAX protease family)